MGSSTLQLLEILACDMSLEGTQFPKHNPAIRLKILLIVFVVEQFIFFGTMGLPLRFISKLVYGQL